MVEAHSKRHAKGLCVTTKSLHPPYLRSPPLFVVDFVDQSPNLLHIDPYIVAMVQHNWRLAEQTDAWPRPGLNDSPSFQRGSLGEPSDEFLNRENHLPRRVEIVISLSAKQRTLPMPQTYRVFVS